ncbi:MAG: hypothetical protein O2798_02545 [Chloroflexi bacterium]|nr:hypothetical protein [Chloroflexota bacterium]MDA1239702.1 hypothetical protein [Chloroflexota bacterium]
MVDSVEGERESLDVLRARLEAARREIERLSIVDDHGSGERTARLAGLSSWQIEAARLEQLIEAMREPPAR